ncbi:MAG TPA: FHA domain-containing protein [Modicisalibacter sp.]|nr:FHA domain-containing protein [Modicisalibacter sp.]
MSTDHQDIDDRRNPPVAESTPPLGAIDIGAAEPEDAERTPTTDTLAPAPFNAEPAPSDGTADMGAKAAPNALRLHDKASNAHGVVSEFPGTIGNSPACDLALKGPGPVGVYARLRHERNAFIIEKAHSEVPLVVNEKELRSVILMDGDILMLGEHEVHIRFDRVEPDAEKEQAKSKRKNRLRVIGAIALVILLLMIVSMAWSRFSEPNVPPLPAPAAETENIAADSASRGWNDRAEGRAEDEPTPAINSVPAEPTPSSEPQIDSPSIVVEPVEIDTVDTSPTLANRNARQLPGPVSVPPAVETATPLVDTPLEIPGTDDTAASAQAATSNAASLASANRLAVSAAIDEAMALYVAGNGEQAIGRLQQTAAEINGAAQQRLQATRERLDQALTAYRSGLAAVDAGRPFELIRQRDRLAAAEQALDTTQPSTYRQTLDDAALIAYRSWAQEADSRNDTASAYRWYRRVLSIQPLDAQAMRRIAALDQAAKEQYLTGYRLETKDIKSALLYWRNAASMVPRDSRWHRLASEKLDDYANFKTRS